MPEKLVFAANFARSALLASNACNLGAVVHGFEQWILYAQKTAHEQNLGTEWINQHVITTVFVQALDNMNHGASDVSIFTNAHEECERIVRGE